MSNINKIFEEIIKLPAGDLKKYLEKRLAKIYGEKNVVNKDGFLYAKGTLPVLLTAHMDTVHNTPVKDLCISDTGVLMSPQGIGGDDRCGIFIIDSVINLIKSAENCAVKELPYVLFTEDEEIGCVGADKFTKKYKAKSVPVNWILEFDRRGNKDCVFYSCDNKDFVKFVETFGWKEDYGSCSDISVIAPHLGVAAANLSSGYYDEHSTREYIVMTDVYVAILRCLKMLGDPGVNTKYEYIEKKYSYNYFGSYRSKYYNYFEDDSYNVYGVSGCGQYNYGNSRRAKTTAVNMELPEPELNPELNIDFIDLDLLTEDDQKDVLEIIHSYTTTENLEQVDFDTGAYILDEDGNFITENSEGMFYIGSSNKIYHETELGIPMRRYDHSAYTAQGLSYKCGGDGSETLVFPGKASYNSCLDKLMSWYPECFTTEIKEEEEINNVVVKE